MQPSKVGKAERERAGKMQFILNHHPSSGLPLCVSGITHRVAVPLEIADHDRRRDAMRRRQRSPHQVSERFVGNREMGSERNLVGGVVRVGDLEKERDVGGDLYVGCTAKAA